MKQEQLLMKITEVYVDYFGELLELTADEFEIFCAYCHVDEIDEDYYRAVRTNVGC